MDQEKIGRFLAKLRKEKNMTQQELADKLGVTDRAISHWENGRALMDISLLKPISEIFDISIAELISGEYVNNDEIRNRSNISIEKTIKYMKKKENKNIIKTIFLTILIPLFIFLISLFLYKVYLINRCYVKIDNNLIKVIRKGTFKINVSFDSKIVNKTNRIRYGTVMIDNNFKNYKLIEPNTDILPPRIYDPYQYVLYDEDNNVIESVTFYDREVYSLRDVIINNQPNEQNKNHKYNKYRLTQNELLSYFIKNNINDDVDLVKYLRKKYYFKNNIFKSIKSIKENKTLNEIANIDELNYDVTFIEGDYKGYIIEFSKNKRELNLISNGLTYRFIFEGSKVTTNNYIVNFIQSTLVWSNRF